LRCGGCCGENVDALHVHHVTSLILSGLAARAAAVPRVVMTEHSLHQFKEQDSYRRAAVRHCRLADAVTVVEPLQVQYFHDEIAVPSTKLHHVSNGVRAVKDPTARRRLRDQLAVSDQDFLLFFAGRLQPIKDVGTLLRSVAELSTTMRRRLRLVVAGDGPERERLHRECGELGLERTVAFIGARSDVPTLMHAADAFIMTSISEGLPMALLEAMVCGVPCIATAVGGIPELFSGGAGVLVPVANPPEIAQAIARLIANPAQRAPLSHRARARIAERHDLDTIVTNYLALLGLPSHWPATPSSTSSTSPAPHARNARQM
jgi:glycosyltransferase involved in cell wall biosynthesis